MNSLDPQIRFRKPIAVLAVLSVMLTVSFPRALADSWSPGGGTSADTGKNSVVVPPPPNPQSTRIGDFPPNSQTKDSTNPGNAGSSPGSDAQTISPSWNSAPTKASISPANTNFPPTLNQTNPSDAPTKKQKSASPSTSSPSATSSSPTSQFQFAPPGKAQSAPLPPPGGSTQSSNSQSSGTKGSAGAASGQSSDSSRNANASGTNLGATSGTPPSSNGPFNGQNSSIGGDSYPSVGRMERLTFGSAESNSPIEERLSKLEVAIYKKSSPELSLFDRTQQLKKTLLGNDDEPTADIDNLRVPSRNWLDNPLGNPLVTSDQQGGEYDYFEGIAQRPENQQTTTPADMKDFALDMINSERSKSGLGPLALDPLAEKMAAAQSEELCQRNVISHANLKGENPDRRYTVGGGTGALTESLVSNKTPDTFSKSPTRAAVALLMKTLMARQDDRDAILNPDATNIGLSINWTPSKDRIIAVTEVVTSHGIIPELPNEIPLGERLEIKGVVMQPYQFDRITVAWEANKALASAADESEEALPYFPPLDYVAYASKSAHDYSGTMTALRTAGVIAAIAGGMFMPPIALAAPLIAMSGGMGTGDPKPVSDIPIHGGVKVEGLTFNGKVPINKDNKEGIYYVTIWGTMNKLGKSVPISRRAILAKHTDEDVSARLEPAGGEPQVKDKKDKKDKKEKHHKDKS